MKFIYNFEDHKDLISKTKGSHLIQPNVVLCKDIDNDIKHSHYNYIYDAEIEYLQSTGTQYIRIPYKFARTDQVAIIASLDNKDSGGTTIQATDKFMVCPETWNNNTNRFAIAGVAGSSKFGCALGNKTTTNGQFTITNDGNLHVWKYDNSKFYLYTNPKYEINIIRKHFELLVPNHIIDTDHIHIIGLSESDWTVKDLSSATFNAETTSIRLFWGYNATSKGKISRYIHVKNRDIVINLIPVRKGNTGYMYDKVSGELYGNTGTGSFILGPDL